MSERDWTEDFELENGNYVNSCTCCTREFTGYKRRTLCRTCSGLPSTKPQGDTEKTEDILAQLAAAKAEIESLQHDLSRHLSITSEQATEILGKEKALDDAIEAERDLKQNASGTRTDCLVHSYCEATLRSLKATFQLKGK